jgi:hypothetical protein
VTGRCIVANKKDGLHKNHGGERDRGVLGTEKAVLGSENDIYL